MVAKKVKKTATKKPGQPSMAERAADMALKNLELEKLLGEVQDELADVKKLLEDVDKSREACRKHNQWLSNELNEWKFKKQSASLADCSLWDWLIQVEEEWNGGNRRLLAQVGVQDWRRCYGDDHGSHLDPFEVRLKTAVDALEALFADHGEGEVKLTVQEVRDCINV